MQAGGTEALETRRRRKRPRRLGGTGTTTGPRHGNGFDERRLAVQRRIGPVQRRAGAVVQMLRYSTWWWRGDGHEGHVERGEFAQREGLSLGVAGARRCLSAGRWWPVGGSCSSWLRDQVERV